MLTRESIIAGPLSKAARHAHIVAGRKGTSAGERRWCIDLIAAIASLSEFHSLPTCAQPSDAVRAGEGGQEMPPHFWRDPETGFVIETQISAGRPAKTVQATDFPICITRGERE